MGQLKNWVNQDWVRIDSQGNIAGKCGTSKNKKNPDRCLPRAKAEGLTKEERKSTAQKKKKAGAKGQTVVANTPKARVSMATGDVARIQNKSNKKNGFIARGCGKVMNNRRKVTTIS